MKKALAIGIALCVLFSLSALAVTEEERFIIAGAYVPADAVFVYEGYDDGFLEWQFQSRDGLAGYELKLDANGRVIEVEYDLLGSRGGKALSLTEAEALGFVTQRFPDAIFVRAEAEKDDGLYEYELTVSLTDGSGLFHVNGEDGTILSYTLYPGVQIGEWNEIVRGILTTRYPGIVILDVDRTEDGGRLVYEAKAEYNGQKYKFEIDATSEQVLKWERDD